jgi:hypothetical protein
MLHPFEDSQGIKLEKANLKTIDFQSTQRLGVEFLATSASPVPLPSGEEDTSISTLGTGCSDTDSEQLSQNDRNGALSQGLKAFGYELRRRVAIRMQLLLVARESLRSCVGPTASTTQAGSGEQTPSLPTGTGEPSSRKRKSSASNWRSSDDGWDDESAKRRKTTSTPEKFTTTGLLFACPYFKHNPANYEKCRTTRACTGPGWESVHRTK